MDLFLLDGQPPEISAADLAHVGAGLRSAAVRAGDRLGQVARQGLQLEPLRYSALGAEELVVFDPEPRGEEAFALQVYRRSPRGRFLRVYAGPGPAESKVLGAWWIVVDGGARVRLARDAAGADLVLTAGERAVAAEARADVAEARVRELEALLAQPR